MRYIPSLQWLFMNKNIYREELEKRSRSASALPRSQNLDNTFAI